MLTNVLSEAIKYIQLVTTSKSKSHKYARLDVTEWFEKKTRTKTKLKGFGPVSLTEAPIMLCGTALRTCVLNRSLKAVRKLR